MDCAIVVEFALPCTTLLGSMVLCMNTKEGTPNIFQGPRHKMPPETSRDSGGGRGTLFWDLFGLRT